MGTQSPAPDAHGGTAQGCHRWRQPDAAPAGERTNGHCHTPQGTRHKKLGTEGSVYTEVHGGAPRGRLGTGGSIRSCCGAPLWGDGVFVRNDTAVLAALSGVTVTNGV
jgi:hypothetical protein